MARFYTMSLQATLFGECALVHEWGRSGQVRETRHTTEAEVQAFAA